MSKIQGHEAAIAAFLDAMRGDRPPHAWIFAGQQGVGKASIAFTLARRLLSEAADGAAATLDDQQLADHRIGRLVDGRSHPDFLMLERLPRDPKVLRDLPPQDWSADIERARSINIDQVRAMTGSFAMKPALSERRVVIVDAVDDLERGGANALLKSLEEPPAGTIFLLVSHAPGRLLPTIRSRCRLLKFPALQDGVMTSILSDALPSLAAEEREALITLSGGAPGRALAIAGLDIAGLRASISRIATDGDTDNRERAALAQSLSTKSAQRRFEAFLALVPNQIADMARGADAAQIGGVLRQWERARDLAGHAIPGSLDPHAVTLELAGIVAALAPAERRAKA